MNTENINENENITNPAIDEATTLNLRTVENEQLAQPITGFELVTAEMVNDVLCGFYKGNSWNVAMTGRDLGTALGYKDPVKAIAHIHKKHQDRLDNLSVVLKVSTTDGKQYDTRVYSMKGIFEICRWSQQKVADAVMDVLYDVFERLVTAGSVTLDDLPQLIHDAARNNPALLSEKVIPALQTADIDQREFVSEYLGLRGDDVFNGRAITTRLELNADGKMLLDRWAEHNIQNFGIEDLPERIRNGFATPSLIRGIAKRNKYLGVFADYCGEIRFDRVGAKMVIDYFVRQNTLKRDEGIVWLTKHFGVRFQ